MKRQQGGNKETLRQEAKERGKKGKQKQKKM